MEPKVGNFVTSDGSLGCDIRLRDKFDYALIMEGTSNIYYTNNTYTVKETIKKMNKEKLVFCLMRKEGFTFKDGVFIPLFVERTVDDI